MNSDSSQTLRRDDRFAPLAGPLVVVVMDGVGDGPGDGGDAVHLASTPTLDRLRASVPTRQLRAHGRAVGLPSDADMGNSEVGHNALGAGRVVRQGAALVGDAIASGALFASETWAWLVEPLVGADHTLHLCGLLSDGNVHAHIDHVHALVNGAAQAGVERLRVHALADGRDVDDGSYGHYLQRLDDELAAHRAAGRDYRIASGGGRMLVTMDRYDADWRIVERGWATHVLGDAPRFADWQAALATLRGQDGGKSDQTLGPFCIADAAGPIGTVLDGDAFVFWNFRGDRAIELTRAFEQDESFTAFDRRRVPRVRFAGMMQYDGDLHLPARFLVAPPQIDRTMGEFTAALGLSTLATSETQKFGHVTYFWNGNRSGRIDDRLEQYIEVPSDRVAFDTAPLMHAAGITDGVLTALRRPKPPRIVRLNYANGDMVGHTGNLAATVQAVQAVDAELARLVAAVNKARGVLLVTADHGNADDMWLRASDRTAKRDGAGAPRPRTSHTLAPVPMHVLDARGPDAGRLWQLRADLPDAGLASVAATCFNLLGYRAPDGYADSLIEPRAPSTRP